MEQDERQVQIGAGDITLLDASRPCSLYWQESSKQISLLFTTHSAGTIFSPSKTCLRRKTGR